MPTARKDIINLNICRYYHCISRCVRRAFLCGNDKETGQSFNHRKVWLVELMQQLAEIFAIKICAYAVMSNHYHLVLYVDIDQALSWSDREVIERWAGLFPMSKAKSYLELGLDFDDLSPQQNAFIQLWREQLMDISWFMRKLNETIARNANKEDSCTGKFWEARFKSQALLDESSLLACMAYVDLNPIRAGISQTPEKSDFTSIQQRIQNYQKKIRSPESLCVFADEEQKSTNKEMTISEPIPCTQLEYFELVDSTGRMVRAGKKGSISAHIKPILERLNIKSDIWSQTILDLSQTFSQFMGRPESIEKCMIDLDRPKMRGLKQAELFFNNKS